MEGGAPEYLFSCCRFNKLDQLQLLLSQKKPSSSFPTSIPSSSPTDKETDEPKRLNASLNEQTKANAEPNIKLNVNWKNPNLHGLTPLHIACQENHIEAVNMLLHHKEILPNTKDEFGVTPLIIAVGNGRSDSTELLLRHPKTDVNLADQFMRTPLWYAAAYGSPHLVSLLLASSPRVSLAPCSPEEPFMPQASPDEVARAKEREARSLYETEEEFAERKRDYAVIHRSLCEYRKDPFKAMICERRHLGFHGSLFFFYSLPHLLFHFITSPNCFFRKSIRFDGFVL